MTPITYHRRLAVTAGYPVVPLTRVENGKATDTFYNISCTLPETSKEVYSEVNTEVAKKKEDSYSLHFDDLH